MFNLIAAFAITSGQVIPVAQAGQELSVLLKTPIEVAKPLQLHHVLIEPHGAGAKVILDGLAATLHASLTKTPTGLKLERTPADLAKMRQERKDERVAAMRQFFEREAKYRAAKVAGGVATDAYFAALERQNEQEMVVARGGPRHVDPFPPERLLPTSELLERLVERIGFEECAELPAWTAKVYEDDPSQGILSLPEHKDLLQAFGTAMAPLQAVAVPNPNPIRLNYASGPSWSLAQPVSRLRVVEEASEIGILFTLEGYDRQGKRVVEANWDVPTIYAKSRPDQELGLSPKWITFSPEDAAAMTFGRDNKTRAFPDWYLHPDQHEPLNLFVREAVDSLLTKSTLPSIALVSDDCWNLAQASQKEGRLNVKAFESTLLNWGSYQDIELGGVQIWRPKDLEATEFRQSDRKVLARFAKGLKDSPSPDIRTFANFYHDSSPGLGALTYFWPGAGQVAAGFSPNVHCSMGAEFFRVLGGLSESSWSRLRDGSSATIGELGVGAEMRAYVQSQITHSKANGLREPTDWDRHLAAFFANGDPEDVKMCARQTTNRLVRGWKNTETKEGWPLDELAKHLPLEDSAFNLDGSEPKLTQTREQFENALKDMSFRYCDQSVAQVVLQEPGGLFLKGDIKTSILPQSDVFTYADFSQDMRDAIWKQAVEKGYADAKFTMDYMKELKKHPPTNVNKTPPPLR